MGRIVCVARLSTSSREWSVFFSPSLPGTWYRTPASASPQHETPTPQTGNHFAPRSQTAIGQRHVAQAVRPSPRFDSAPGTKIYPAKHREAIPTVAHRYLSRTSYRPLPSWLSRSAPSITVRLVEHSQEQRADHRSRHQSRPGHRKDDAIARDFEVRAIYLTGYMAAAITASA